ncbi:MAG: hypothetical protein AB4426_25625 [Xenococcaceae cyanobacterium]
MDCYIPYSSFPHYLFPISYSLFPIPCCLLPVACCLLPIPCSLFPVPSKVLQRFITISRFGYLFYHLTSEGSAKVEGQSVKYCSSQAKHFKRSTIPTDQKVIDMMVPMFPVLLFFTALGSVLLYQRTSHDIFAVLAAGTAIVCIIWGLAIAHWSVHLLSLIVLLKFKSPIMRMVQAIK